MSVTPESAKTVSMTSQGAMAAEGPTPKNEFKKPTLQRQHFMSPTDAMVSPCTQKLITSRRMPKKPATGKHRPRYIQTTHQPSSKLANKENEHKAQPQGKPLPSEAPPHKQATPLETNV